MFKRKFNTLKDIENFLIYTPPIFIIIFSFIAIIITTTILENKENSKIDLIIQKEEFLKKDILQTYVNDVNSDSHASFDKVEILLRRTIYELKGYLNAKHKNKQSLTELLKNIENFKKKKDVEFVVFNTKTYKLYHGKDIIHNLQALTNSNIQTNKFRKNILKNIYFIGKENLQYWIDNDKRKIRLSYFESIDNKDIYVGVFSKVDDIKYLTKNTILNTISLKSRSIEGYYWFYDYLNKYVYNYHNQKFKTMISDLKDKNELIKMYENKKIHKLAEVYDFKKYQYLVVLNKSKTLKNEIKLIKEEYRQKNISAFTLIFLISLFLIVLIILFSKYITKIFEKYNHRLSLKNKLYKEWRDRYELAIIASNDGFWDVDFESNKIYFSKPWLNMFSYKKGEIETFDAWFDLIHEEDKALVKKSLDAHLNGTISNFICEYRIKAKNNQYKWILARGKVFKNKENIARRMIMMSMDIDDKKRLSQELKDMESLVKVGSMVLFKYRNNDNLEIEYLSDSISSYGYLPNEIKSYINIVHQEDKILLQNKIQDALKNNINSFFLTYRIYKKDKTIRWIANRTILLKDHFGSVSHLYGYLTDVTKMKLNEQDLKDKIKKEVEKNREKDRLLVQQNKLASMGEMIGNIAHQWRQPLNNTNLLIHYIRDNFKNFKEDELRETIAQAKLQIDFMSQTIDDFRNFYQANKDKVDFDIKQSVLEASKILSTPFEKSNISLEINSKNIKIYNYKNEFQQVLVNILNNAYDAAVIKLKEQNFKPKVIIDIFKKEQNVYILIKNNCGNINEEVEERMFEPYYTTKFENRGTGIGLYMSKTIIEKNMLGSISAKNEEDGVIFTIILSL